MKRLSLAISKVDRSGVTRMGECNTNIKIATSSNPFVENFAVEHGQILTIGTDNSDYLDFKALALKQSQL